MKKNAKITPLGSRQLFHMKNITLERRVKDYFQATNNASNVIEYLVAILVRNALIYEDFSFLCQSLVEEIFMTAEPSETLRRYSALFKPYFRKSGDWDKVVSRLFTNTKEYYRLSKEMRVITKYLYTEAQSQEENTKSDCVLVSFFKDSNGRKQTWILKDANPNRPREETEALLKLLSTLTIFTGKSSRKFAEFVTFDHFGKINQYEKTQAEPAQDATEQEFSEKEDAEKETLTIMVPHGSDPRELSDEEAVALIRAHLPEGKTLADVEILFVERQAEESQEQSMTQSPHESRLNEARASNTNEQRAIGIADPPQEDARKTRSESSDPLSQSQSPAKSLNNKSKKPQTQNTANSSGKNKKIDGSRRKKKKGKKWI